MSIDITKLQPVLEDAAQSGATFAAEKHRVAKTYVQSLLSLARKLGAAPPRGPGAQRNYDPADVVAALAAKPLPAVEAQFGLSAGTLLKIAADHKKSLKVGGVSAGSGAPVQAAA